MFETTQFSNKVFCSRCFRRACASVNVFLFSEGHFSTWTNLLLPLCLSPASFVCPTASSLISSWKKKKEKRKGLTHDNWAPGLCTNHMTERVVSTNHSVATAGLCDVTERGDFFVQPSVLRVWQITLLHTLGHTHTHTQNLLFLHACYKGGTANPRFSPGVLMVLVMVGMRQTVFVWGPELDFNQSRHLPTPAKPLWMRSCIKQRHTRTRRGSYSLWGYEV